MTFHTRQLLLDMFLSTGTGKYQQTLGKMIFSLFDLWRSSSSCYTPFDDEDFLIMNAIITKGEGTGVKKVVDNDIEWDDN